MTIEIKSYNQLLGAMIRKVIAETALNDINTGSALLSLLEAAASNDFENNVSILNVLELLNIDAVKNNDLDSRAADYGLVRTPAIRASGLVTIFNTNIVKRSTGLYVIKPAPIAGQTTLYVNTTTGWSPTGDLYIGRGTESFEGPITYSAITVFPTYSAITLTSSLQKDHLSSEVVIDSQGQPDISISAGQIVQIPSNSQHPEIIYTTLRDAVIPAGEDRVENVDVIADIPGSSGNAPINAITNFTSEPFTGAGVANTTSFTNGGNVETDVTLRNRIKSYSVTLARGTSPSIIAAVIGVSDPDDSKQVASAVLTEPVKVGDPSILYIDDGSGFEPSFEGQSVDKLLSNANGSEVFLQLANYPLPRPQIINIATGPYNVIAGSFLRVEVDGTEETIFFADTDFLNPSAATISEIIIVINKQSVSFKARFANYSNNILLYPITHDVETIRVSTARSSENIDLYLNGQLKFPTNEFSYIALYQNSTRLKEKEFGANIETEAFAAWNIIATGNIIISVDGTPAQDRNFALSDFPGATSFVSLSLQDWVDAFNSKFAGLSAETTPSQTMIIRSNRIGATSKIEVVGGTYLSKWFPNSDLVVQGQSAQFQLNRQTGHIRILTSIIPGDALSAGVEDAKGYVVSASTVSGNYNVSNDGVGRPAESVIVIDSTFCTRRSISLLVGATIDITATGSVMRVTSSTIGAFVALLPGDYFYITKKTAGWVSTANTGLYKIISKGGHTVAGTDSFIEVLNVGAVSEAGITIIDSLDIKAFATDGYPQIWRGSYVGNPPSEPISGVIASLNTSLLNVNAAIFRSNSIKLTSTTELGGSIAVPISIGNASVFLAETEIAQEGNPPHIANRLSDKPLTSTFKRTIPTSTNVWLNRHTYTDMKGALTATSTPDPAPFASTYSEIIESTGNLTAANVSYDDYVSFTRGDNRGQFRTIKASIVGDQVGTQQGTNRTLLDHVVGDEFELVRPIQLSSEDSVVVVMDQDSTNKTIDIRMARTGLVNSLFAPTTTEFSANDADNEPGVTFSDLAVWGTSINNTNFSDYAVWMQSRNWYSTGGIAGSGGKFLIRSTQYGPNGDQLRFNIKHPSIADQDNSTFYVNTPSHTTFTYVFGSGPERATGITAGDTVAIAGPYADDTVNFPSGATSAGNYYDYTFSNGIGAAVAIDDIISINAGSGLSTFNRGQFRVANVSGSNVVRVFNPNASITAAGTPEVTSITTTADIVGTPTVYTITTTADVAASLDLEYFTIYDAAGSVAVWFDIDNSGSPPPPHGADRAIKVASIASNDSASVVATQIGLAIALDNAFTVGVIGNQVTITNVENGPLANASAGTSGFGVLPVLTGTNNITNDGQYFIIYDEDGSVAVWLDVDDDGTPEPFHGADRSIAVTGIISGNSAATVAAAITAAINPEVQFIASSLGAVITITRASNGNIPASSAGTTGWAVSDINGTLASSELITNESAILVFPITGTSVADIATKVNESDIVKIVAVGSDALEIIKATVEDDYTYISDSTALSFGHNPTSASLRGFSSLYDGSTYVKTFSNVHPNFTLKTATTLQGVAPSIYSMNTAPNPDTADLGEYFKLIPVSVKNIHHHFTQKALSQLPIVAKVAISRDRKNVQISSKNLGSAGAIEVVGGNANKAQAYLVGESEVSTDTSGAYLLVKTPAFPDTFNKRDIIKLQNDAGVKRLSRLVSTDTITTTSSGIDIIEYNYNPKAISFSATTQISITDVSASHGRPAGYVWRWTHDGLGGASFSSVREGDLLMAFGTLAGFSQGNLISAAGDSKITGFPVIAVNDTSNYVDVSNPYGRSMVTTAIGPTLTVQICPSPIIKWQLKHSARDHVTLMSRAAGIVTVLCAAPHFLNTGDSIDIINSDNVPDATYTTITATGPNTFTFALAGSNFVELDVGATIIKTGSVATRYRVEKLGFSDMVRISRQDGDSPRFTDCGVAVDDYIILGGDTFKSNNNGRFRVAAVDNDSVIIINASAADELNTIRPINNKSLAATWTANTSIITGVAGTFKNLVVGSWIKKPEDTDDKYRQVTALFPATPALATSITIGSNYSGATAIAAGVLYNQLSDYDKGVELLGAEDIVFYDGDSAAVGDNLFIQNIINPNWFSVGNIGSFSITEVGINTSTFKPFLRIKNPTGTLETNRFISVNTEGFYLTEGLVNRFYSIRQVDHAVLDDLNPERRSLYITPSNRNYKFTNANATSILHMGKFGYNTDVTLGVDGYLYYTGLLRRVQRIVDGYEPDAENFPGRRSVGGLIETLPPLIRRVSITVNVTTGDGVNLGDISNNIKSAVINYVGGLGVGEDVILSEIIAAIIAIKGVAAVTFTNPIPSTERITIADNEKATITPNDIGIA